MAQLCARLCGKMTEIGIGRLQSDLPGGPVFDFVSGERTANYEL